MPLRWRIAQRKCAYSSRRGESAGSSMAISSREMFAPRATSSIVSRRPRRVGMAMPSSTRIDAARMIFGSSPSGKTMRLRVADRAIDDAAHDAARASEPRLEAMPVLVDVDEVRARRWRPPPRPPPARPTAARADRTGRESDSRDRRSRSSARTEAATLSGTSSRASSASARVAAIFISSLISVARTSSAPRKMNGKPRTLLTWLG